MSLSIKESFRTMNFLDGVINSLTYYLRDTNNAMKVTEKHYKLKSNSEATDEDIDATTERTYKNTSVVDIAYLVEKIVNEKTKLALAIERAKSWNTIDYKEDGKPLSLDSAIETAKKSRDFANVLKTLIDLKSTETKKQGIAYKFNAEGNQMPYKYDIDVVKTIDFDRNNINALYKKLLDKADKISTMIETIMLKEIVEYTPVFDIHDSVTDIVEKHIVSK